jgi:hypothetical protein
MKRILCIAIACILASVLVSASDVSAININKVIGNEYYINGTSTTYAGGNYAGSAVGVGMMVINASNIVAVITVITDLSVGQVYPGVFQYYCNAVFGPYTQRGNQLKIDTCTISCTGQEGTPIVDYDGTCDATINLQGRKKLNATISYTPSEGVVMVYTGTGKLLGTYPPTP